MAPLFPRHMMGRQPSEVGCLTVWWVGAATSGVHAASVVRMEDCPVGGGDWSPLWCGRMGVIQIVA
jgi:hypothetical protein